MRRRSRPIASSGTCSATGRWNWQSPCCKAPDSPPKIETQETIAYIFDEISKLLHPFMPFITEELWVIKGEEGPKRETILALAPGPISMR